MSFAARPRGLTVRRLQEALVAPHSAAERFDPDFQVAMRCSKCGKIAHGPRAFLAEAMREHLESDCPARKTKENEPQLMRLYYPKQ